MTPAALRVIKSVCKDEEFVKLDYGLWRRMSELYSVIIRL